MTVGQACRTVWSQTISSLAPPRLPLPWEVHWHLPGGWTDGGEAWEAVLVCLCLVRVDTEAPVGWCAWLAGWLAVLSGCGGLGQSLAVRPGPHMAGSPVARQDT